MTLCRRNGSHTVCAEQRLSGDDVSIIATGGKGRTRRIVRLNLSGAAYASANGCSISEKEGAAAPLQPIRKEGLHALRENLPHAAQTFRNPRVRELRWGT